MRFIPMACVAGLVALSSVPAAAQLLHCVDPPSVTPSEAACRIDIDATTRELRMLLQLRGADDKPIPDRLVRFEANSGTVRDTARTDDGGYVAAIWRGTLQPEPVIVTARASFNGVTTSRQIRLARRTPPAPPYIKSVAPAGDHSAFAGRYLSEDVEVQIESDPSTCNRTTVVFEYLSVGTGSAPEPKQYNSPAMWSELDRNRFGCAARLRWALAPIAGKQTMRTWIKRDSAFTPPQDEAGVQRYLRPHDVRAIAHALPSFMAGAAVIEAGDTGVPGDTAKVPDIPALATVVGIDVSFPTVAELFKHGGLQGMGELVDRTRFFLGTDFSKRPGRHVYLGVEPLVLLIGPRAADVPVSFAAGRRLGNGQDRWFGAGFVNASSIAEIVLSGLGIKK